MCAEAKGLGHAARQDAAPPKKADTLFPGILQGARRGQGADRIGRIDGIALFFSPPL